MTLNFQEDEQEFELNKYLAIDDEPSQDIDDSDDDLEEDIDPATVVTKHSFSSSPWSTIGVVGGAFFLAFGGCYLFLNGIFNGKSPSTVVQKKEPLPKEENEKAEVNNDDVYAKGIEPRYV